MPDEGVDFTEERKAQLRSGEDVVSSLYLGKDVIEGWKERETSSHLLR